MVECVDQIARDALGDHKHEIERLNGELLAIRTLLFYFMDGATVSSPHLVRTAFDNAADFIERFTISAGKTASPEHTVKALEIVEDLRSKIFPKTER